MTRWGTVREFRKAVDKEVVARRGDPLTNDEWLMVKPDHSPDYDDQDFREVLSYLRLPKTIKEAFNLQQSIVPSDVILKFRRFAPMIRGLLGLTEPIKLDRLEETLSQFKVDDGLVLQYPIARERLEGFWMWEIRSIEVSDRNWKLVQFMGIIEGLARTCNCHPALVLAYFLCRQLLYEDKIVAFTERGKITLQIRSLDVPVEAIRKAYSMVKDKQVKVRGQRDRMIKLLTFIRGHCGISWDERFKLWNKEHPNWQYGSVASMQAVCSRAAPLSLLKRSEALTEKFAKEYSEWLEGLGFRRIKD